jgi:hypothetical protein
MAVSDFDGDGGLDFIVNNYNAPAQYFVNRVPNRGHWLRIRLRGRQSNREGIGAILRARAGDLRMMRVVTAGDGYASQYSRVVHFGLGDAAAVDQLEISWPSGRKQTFTNVAADRFIEIDESEPDVRLIRLATTSSRIQ